MHSFDAINFGMNSLQLSKCKIPIFIYYLMNEVFTGNYLITRVEKLENFGFDVFVQCTHRNVVVNGGKKDTTHFGFFGYYCVSMHIYLSHFQSGGVTINNTSINQWICNDIYLIVTLTLTIINQFARGHNLLNRLSNI